MEKLPAQLAVRLSSVSAAGITHDGKGFVHFTSGETVHVHNACAGRVASSLSSGAQFITIYAVENPAGGRNPIWREDISEARNDAP